MRLFAKLEQKVKSLLLVSSNIKITSKEPFNFSMLFNCIPLVNKVKQVA